MLATLLGEFSLLFGLAVLLLPLLATELSRPRDGLWGAVVLMLGLGLITSSDRLQGPPMLAVICGALLVSRLGVEVAQNRWQQLSSDDQQGLISRERWTTSLKQLGASIANLGSTLKGLMERLRPKPNADQDSALANEITSAEGSEPSPESGESPEPLTTESFKELFASLASIGDRLNGLIERVRPKANASKKKWVRPEPTADQDAAPAVEQQPSTSQPSSANQQAINIPPAVSTEAAAADQAKTNSEPKESSSASANTSLKTSVAPKQTTEQRSEDQQPAKSKQTIDVGKTDSPKNSTHPEAKVRERPEPKASQQQTSTPQQTFDQQPTEAQQPTQTQQPSQAQQPKDILQVTPAKAPTDSEPDTTSDTEDIQETTAVKTESTQPSIDNLSCCSDTVTQGKQPDGVARTSYKDTLNLLQTSFGMRANASQREPELQEFWKQQGIDLELGLNNQGQNFTLHDGPPYANGALHMGHALNKVLKDIINKHQILRGRQVRFVPGWDCHGLPIELKVLQNLNQEQREALTPLKLRKKAAAFARKQVDSQMAGFRRWGIWADWEHPYLTLQKEYEAAQIQVFGTMFQKGYIYRGLKPVHWSPSSRTALAEAELEYPDGHTSPSVYVAFPAAKLPENLRTSLGNQGLELPNNGLELGQALQIAIWTTTPWTLPANLAVSVNEKLDYSFAVDNQGRLLLVAAELLPSLRDTLALELTARATVKGALLAGLIYKHPLLDRDSPIVIGGEYITTESGTGLVHTAPGHGVDDFNTGQKHDLGMLCPVDESGTMTSEAGPFAGLNVLKDANPTIIAALEERGALLKHEPYAHRYPYDWRTKKPTIFRATEQWFASVEGFRNEALTAINSVEWLPASGRNRMEAMVRERGDWCISRQRTWGVPIPVFYEREGNEVLLNDETLAHVKALITEHGADVWWERNEVELLPPAYAEEAKRWRKGTDTMDVWFDSGSSWAAVASQQDGLAYPAELYLEGSDQHRGWFQSSLLTSVAINSQAPYRQVLTHGFALDEKGRKMSKSLGNVVDPAVIIDGGKNQKQEPPYGADVLRLWVSSVDYSADVPIGASILRQIADVYRKVRNTSRYLLGNLHDFDPERDAIPVQDLPLLDRWMLQRTAEVMDEISTAFDRYEFYRFFQLLQSYCVVDLSNFYLDIAKDRLYVSSPSERRRRSCQTVMALIIERLAGAISPVLCHMAEDIWQNLPYSVAEDSVFRRGWPTVPETWRDPSMMAPMHQLRELRSAVNRVLEDCRSQGELGAALEAAVRLEAHSEALQEALDWLRQQGDPDVDGLRDWLLVSHLQVGGEPWAELLASQDNTLATIEVARARGSKCERCWHYETDVGQHKTHPTLCGRCVGVLEHQ
ncbi:Isoleucine--tRNA ligase [Prochlorococcus marinus str. MIT 1327]|nr:Isoleucine--tRNA ligase [Prochlorococcus marinus str. MIT 1312]KZR78864.1 Isoleucine--tRNA ligase [Prochlorococcus marinus str. MIT 1327]